MTSIEQMPALSANAAQHLAAGVTQPEAELTHLTAEALKPAAELRPRGGS